jgi:DNA replication protein DnaC
MDMGEMQTTDSSSQPVATQQTDDEELSVWKEPKRLPLFRDWDFDILDAPRCISCGYAGVYYPREDYYESPVHLDAKQECYRLDRSDLYKLNACECHWQIRGREILANFPPFLLRKAQDSFQWATWQSKRAAYEAYLADIERRTINGEGLLLIGSVGTGKTHLAVHAGRVALRNDVSGVFFTTVTDLLSDLRQTFHDDSPVTEKQIMAHVRSVDLLILDDAAVEKQTDWTQDALYRVINARYETEMATIVTANTSMDAMRDRLGERLVSRLYERSLVLDFTGPDYRIQERKQRQAT